MIGYIKARKILEKSKIKINTEILSSIEKVHSKYPDPAP